MLENLVIQFVSLAGVAAFIAALINTGKAFGIVKDGYAQNVSFVLSLVAFIAFVGFKFFAPEVDIAGIDEQAAKIAEFILYILGFLVQMGLPARVHNWLWGVPIFGYSHSEALYNAEG